ncbi:CRISPR-associated protein Cas7/Cst2/DevR [Sporotomaculum syntrophicum]|uniref:CRISPR-associated protein Cas7/Cst2/DevR n=1 Tax=Sporotomaculum syntrophicum TaxID=182264 RepID=A0A9D3AWK8_9FIRM|nr:DevR family CRISPR-associated autoregulator [Sporotomaculum syntrophicum]KAF1083922.1 CRISPR-associated protein Cas7/Cst2/DevR [Sporotomaculum syntrophicum]
MGLYVYGAVLTPHGIAANNRGETEGNITTLQKILWHNQIHTTVSAEAIRWAIRYNWQKEGTPVNRVWDELKEDYTWRDPKWLAWNPDNLNAEATYIDDDVLGFMLAEAAGTEGNDDLENKKKEKKKLDDKFKELSKEQQKSEEGKELKKKSKELNDYIKAMSKGTCDKRRGVLEIARAISTTPFAGDITFNSKAGTKDRTSLYGTEVHATRYQYGFAFTPERLQVKERALKVIDAIANLGEVAGNHSRFLFDFSPESIILRLTSDPAPRLLYCFEENENETISVPELVRRVNAGDIDAKELYIGGPIAEDNDIKGLKDAFKATGIKKTVEEFKKIINSQLLDGEGKE